MRRKLIEKYLFRLQWHVEELTARYFERRNIRLQKPENLKKCRIIAHRGKAEPHDKENTLSSFRKCLEKKVWAIEFDIRWTADNVPVVHHDSTTKRVFNKQISIAKCKFAELREKVPEIPTLREVVKEFGKKVHLMIEPKDISKMSAQQKEKLSGELKELHPGKDFHLMSFELEQLDELNFEAQSKVGIAVFDMQKASEFVLKKGWRGLTAPYFLLPDHLSNQHLEKGQIVGTGFVPNRSVLNRELNRSVPWIFTNESSKLISEKEKFLPDSAN